MIQTQLVGTTPIDVRFHRQSAACASPKLSYRVTPAVKLLNDAMRLELDYQYFGNRYSDARERLRAAVLRRAERERALVPDGE